ncbi:MAG: hypothetical protein AABN33_21895 [Acidobacteriota bacterium]
MIRIGVTGHRILAEPGKIEAGVEEALRRIQQAFSEEPLTVVSALAEGADRIVARHVLGLPGARLVVPLPLAKSDYMSDFKTEPSRAEFLSLLEQADQVIEMSPASTRDRAYEAAGEYVLNHADVLVALWDGRDAQGQGGTGEMVARARARGLPIAWVHAGNRDAGTHQPTSLGDEQGRVTFENI